MEPDIIIDGGNSLWTYTQLSFTYSNGFAAAHESWFAQRKPVRAANLLDRFSSSFEVISDLFA